MTILDLMNHCFLSILPFPIVNRVAQNLPPPPPRCTSSQPSLLLSPKHNLYSDVQQGAQKHMSFHKRLWRRNSSGGKRSSSGVLEKKKLKQFFEIFLTEWKSSSCIRQNLLSQKSNELQFEFQRHFIAQLFLSLAVIAYIGVEFSLLFE